ncbi:hypothetical protein cyc_08978 [Cyclospora cayetanensis]|uniref:Anaphase-promoting complex subunit 4-like WD40 domain-containing protein n=1 Tax=Cyclospora cayetanensis TaxID=88456 RepID=A0A1D3D5U3_9EIME|nr:hypothetical protein cyc_08978 [Cyclospora cayetanensis]
MQPQPHLLQHMLVDRRDSRASDPASFARSLRVSEAPSQEGGMAPVVPLSPRGGGGTRGALPPSRTGEVPGAPPPSQATASTEGSRNVSCVQFATVNEAVLALGFESGALEFWLLPLPPGEGPPQEGEGAPQEGACTPACRCVADTSSEPPDGAALGSAEEDHSSLLKALHTLHEQKQHLQQQQSQQHLCSTWEGALRGSPEVTALAWHPHELLLAAAYADGRIALWKLETQELSMNSPASPTAGGDAGEACVTVHRMHTFLFACPVPEPSASVQEVLGAPWTDAEGPSPAAAADVLLHSPTSLVWGPEGECLVVGSREGALLLWSLGALRQYQRAAALLEAGGGAPLRGPSGRRLMVPPSGNPAFLLKKDAFSSAEKVAALSSEGSLSLHDSVPRIRGGSSLKTLSNASTQPSSASPPDTPEKIPSAVGEDPPPWGSPSATAPVPQICEPFEGTGSTQWLAPPTEPDDSRCLRDAHSRLLQRFLPHFGGPRVQLHVPEETPSCPLRRRHPESSAARGPSISGVWLLGISSVIREAHGGKVRCLSFCVHDSRVLLSAGDTAAGAAGSRGLLLPMPACGSSKLKLWFQDSEAIQPFPILEIFLEGLVTSMLWSRLTGELLLAHSWRRPCGASYAPPVGALKNGKGPGNGGRGGVTVWCYLGDGGKSLLERQPREHQQLDGVGGKRREETTRGPPASWAPSGGSAVYGDCAALLQPLLLKIGGFGERPVMRESSNTDSNTRTPTPDAAASTGASTSSGGPPGGASLSPPFYSGGPRSRPGPHAVSSYPTFNASHWGAPGGGFLLPEVLTDSPRRSSWELPGSQTATPEDAAAAHQGGCYAKTDNASSLVQSADGRAVAYWSLPAETIAVWALSPPKGASRWGPFSTLQGPTALRRPFAEGPSNLWQGGQLEDWSSHPAPL